MNILGYSQEGIAKINTYKTTFNTKNLFDKCQRKMIIKLNKDDIGLDSFKRNIYHFSNF